MQKHHGALALWGSWQRLLEPWAQVPETHVCRPAVPPITISHLSHFSFLFSEDPVPAGAASPVSSGLHQSRRPQAVIGQSLSHAQASESHQMKTSLTLVITITIVIGYDDRQRCPGDSHRPGMGTRRVTLTAAQRLRWNWERCFNIKLKFRLSKQS